MPCCLFSSLKTLLTTEGNPRVRFNVLSAAPVGRFSDVHQSPVLGVHRGRALVRKHFPNARIVADRFHVIRLVNHHFLACWRELDAAGSKNRGLLSLVRRRRHKLTAEQQARLAGYLAAHPVLELIYRFKQRLCYLLLKKHRTRKQCQTLAPRLLRAIDQLRQTGLPQLVQLGETLHSWSQDIATMWRFTRSNGITEGFHTKMEVLQRQAYGYRNFQNYRLRVKVMCS